MATRMPAVFFGHGNPMNALTNNAWTQGWTAFGQNTPRPHAVLCVSAHWYLSATLVTATQRPRTIHDFGGFPRELYEVDYAAPGDPQLAKRVRDLLSPVPIGLDDEWGLDHGTWSVLRHVFPKADVPIIQLSLDETKPASFHYDLARRLSSLRDEGVLIVGSGNLVHNLHAYSWGRHPVEPFDWAVRFEQRVRELILARDHAALVNYEALGRDATLAIPTPEHYLPLLYVLAQQQENEPIHFPVTGFDGGSISMLSIQVA
ncbi:MAG: 4,5-DOPA dioxygenase extradiol [Betaproteobacteria bacterium]